VSGYGHAVTRLALSDELLDAQLLRAVGHAAYGGSDIGECLATAGRVKGTDLDSWYDAWTATAESVLDLADSEAAAGRSETARLAYWRASTYFRTAGVMLLGPPINPRLAASNARQTATFRRGAALLATPPEILELPYDGTTLPGYFFRATGEGRPRPTTVLIGGYDGTAEELYFFNGAAALARGYNVLAFDGPGQGGALLHQGLVLRPDWGHVVTPVLDYALSRPDVDADRVALIGLSLGAYLAPRAASAEHRVAACIADCGSFDLYAAAIERIPSFLRGGLDNEKSVAGTALRRVIRTLNAKPTAGWALRRGQLVHGVSDPISYLRLLPDYSLREHAAEISCPTLVCHADADDISASAPQLFAALTCEKTLLTFTTAEGAGDHCEAGARTLFHARAFGWLDEILQPAR
jgi:pimeloyl-ACP methyl ester carboxylesterase